MNSPSQKGHKELPGAVFLNIIQRSFLVPLIGGRWYIIPQWAVYTTYIPLIYCLLGDLIYHLPPIQGTRNSCWNIVVGIEGLQWGRRPWSMFPAVLRGSSSRTQTLRVMTSTTEAKIRRYIHGPHKPLLKPKTVNSNKDRPKTWKIYISNEDEACIGTNKIGVCLIVSHLEPEFWFA